MAGTLLALAWFSRIIDAALGMPSVADVSRPEWDRNPVSTAGNPRVSIIVPARNEEATLEGPLRQLLALDYDNYEVIAVNDRSTDGTGEIMERVAAEEQDQNPHPPAKDAGRMGQPLEAQAAENSRVSQKTREMGHPERGMGHPLLRVIHHQELPAGWMGKTHAMWTAANQAGGEWLLFTDADVLFKPGALRRALAYAEAERADHVVLFPRMIMKSPGEFMMIAFFQAMFMFGHRPWKVADPKAKDHMGVGAFNLVRRSTYDAVGTYAALRMEVLDDMKLGKVIKNAGFRQRNVFGEDLISIRWAHGAMGVVNNLTKNFFAVLSFQWWRAAATVVAMAFLNLMPFVGVLLAHGWARVPYAVALFGMFSIYVGMSLRSAVPFYYFVLHPVSTVLFLYTLVKSTVLTLWDDGIMWRGTKYDLEELRKGMV